MQLHYLRGTWADGTLKHYTSAVTKLIRFAEVKGISKADLLPISANNLKRFVVWASRKQEEKAADDESVTSSTVKAYIAGIRAWHLFHGETYPEEADGAIAGLLKASRKIEAEFEERDRKRPPVLIADLVILSNNERQDGERGTAMYALALCAFWGMARLGELVSDDDEKRLPTWEDVYWGPNSLYARITILGAKTAKPGEKQYIHVHRQKSKLDPVQALANLFHYREKKMSEALFTLKIENKTEKIKKNDAITYFRKVWDRDRPENSRMLYGHSFRIGGASLRWNLGSTRETLKVDGRWKSDTYKIYLRKFSQKDLEKTIKLLEELSIKST